VTRLLLAVLLASLGASLQPPADLPVIETPTAQPGRSMALLITGDGGWAAGDRALARGLADAGVPVAAIDARAYFSKPRSPGEAAADWERVARWYLARWHRDSLLVIGYSRGADVSPFIVNRIPMDLRARVRMLVMVGLSPRASFQFHWVDLVRDVARPTDLATRPEVEKLRGLPMLCISGAEEEGSLCPALDPSLATRLVHGGKHVMSADDGRAIATTVLATRS
jgi:type IV secretory pathway VirJ component